jgi:hypothetical protein
MRQEIKGFDSRANPILKDYGMDTPEGQWTGRLDELAWGQSSNLFCFFTDTASGKKYRLSVFNEKGYMPSKGGPAFDQELLGGIFEITTGKSKKGLPTFLTAKKV